MSRLGKISLPLACALMVLVAGIWLGGHPKSLPGPVRDALVDDDRALRAEIVDAIEESYYKPVEESEIEESSLRGIVAGLGDRFSSYLTPEETEAFEQSVQGEFEGVGMGVDQDRRGLRVITVFEDTPAERAGIDEGDFITAVDGRSIAGVSSDVATARIKGEAGTQVRLEVVDPETGEIRRLRVERARIEVPVAEARVVRREGAGYGVVELTTFSSGAHGRLREEVDRLLKRGAEGLVLDLRGNGGGLLEEAVLVSSVFIEDGLITFTDGRSRERVEFEAQGDAIDGDVPVVVLVNGGSASASEIVTGALRDRERATVVGQKTFGKGVFQEVQELSNGGLLDITVGQYFLPSGENIGMKGIRPSVRAVDDPDTERDEALPVALRTLVDEAGSGG